MSDEAEECQGPIRRSGVGLDEMKLAIYNRSETIRKEGCSLEMGYQGDGSIKINRRCAHLAVGLKTAGITVVGDVRVGGLDADPAAVRDKRRLKREG